jgi:hypothetical protein
MKFYSWRRLPLPSPGFSFFFAKGLGKPLSKPSSGQASDGMGNQSSTARRSLPVMETNLFDPETVLANEAFPKGSPRPDSFSHPASDQTQASPEPNTVQGRQACLCCYPFFIHKRFKKLGQARLPYYHSGD